MTQSANGAVADRHEEPFARHGRVTQDVQGHRRQVDAGQIELGLDPVHPLDVALHLRRLAEQDLHRHVDRPLAAGSVFEHEHPVVTGHPDDGERAPLTFTQPREEFQSLGSQRDDVALLALVAPGLLGRKTALFQRNCAQIEPRPQPCTVDELREGIGQPPSPHVVDREDRVVLTQRPAVVDDLLRPSLDLGVAALHRVEVQVSRVRSGRHR